MTDAYKQFLTDLMKRELLFCDIKILNFHIEIEIQPIKIA